MRVGKTLFRYIVFLFAGHSTYILFYKLSDCAYFLFFTELFHKCVIYDTIVNQFFF